LVPGLDEQSTSVIAFVVGHRPEQRAVLKPQADGMMGDAKLTDFSGVEITNADDGATDKRF